MRNDKSLNEKKNKTKLFQFTAYPLPSFIIINSLSSAIEKEEKKETEDGEIEETEKIKENSFNEGSMLKHKFLQSCPPK